MTTIKVLTFMGGLALGLSACASQQSPAEQGLNEPSDPSTGGIPAPTGDPGTGRPEDRCAAFASPGTIKRSVINEVVDQGLGVWLQGVRVQSVKEGKRFKGWKIESLHLANPCYAAVDLRPGDIVLKVNGDSVESDARAHEVWKTLKTATGIEVDYERNGERKSLRFGIAAD